MPRIGLNVVQNLLKTSNLVSWKLSLDHFNLSDDRSNKSMKSPEWIPNIHFEIHYLDLRLEKNINPQIQVATKQHHERRQKWKRSSDFKALIKICQSCLRVSRFTINAADDRRSQLPFKGSLVDINAFDGASLFHMSQHWTCDLDG